MPEFLDLQERIERFNHITNQATISEDHGLLKTFSLGQLNQSRLVFALNYYLYTNLTRWYKDKIFHFSDNILHDYSDEILNLPNITPNGLILPKVENLLAYNFLHAEYVRAFSEIGINDKVDTIQFPINIRLVKGTPNPVVDQRPLSSTKPHVDIWAGDPASAMLVFLSLLGEPEKAGLDFLFTPYFPKKFARPLADHNEGKEVADMASKLTSLCHGKWFIMDSYLLHQTKKNGDGLRISIDIRFIPKKIISSDTHGTEEHSRFFSSLDKWSTVSSDYWITTNELMSNKPKSRYDFSIINYPNSIEKA